MFLAMPVREGPVRWFRRSAPPADWISRAFDLVAGTPVRWRVLAVLMVPVGFWAFGAIYDYVPQSAGAEIFVVRVNRLTGTACIHSGLEELAARLVAEHC